MKLFVWDFHGVLEKGNEHAVLKVSNDVLREFGYKQRFDLQTCLKLYGVKWYKYFEYLLPEEPHQKHLELQAAGFKKTKSHPEIIAHYTQPNKYAHRVLDAIAKKHRQILISNTKPQSLKVYLKSVSMEKYFNDKNAFAVGAHQKNPTIDKQKVLKKFLGNKKFDETIVIGDSQEDMQLALAVEGKFYLYSHPERTIEGIKADNKINDLRALLKEL